MCGETDRNWSMARSFSDSVRLALDKGSLGLGVVRHLARESLELCTPIRDRDRVVAVGVDHVQRSWPQIPRREGGHSEFACYLLQYAQP